MPDLVLLRAPLGADGGAISHGPVQFFPFREDPYDPESDWLVRVPPDAARQLVHNAGFEMMPHESQTPAPVGMAILAHPEGPTLPDGTPRTLGIAGVTVRPGEDGLYRVPAHLVPEALPHGWDAPERVAARLKEKLEAALGAVDGAEVTKEIAAAVEQAAAEREAAVARADAAEAERDAAVHGAAVLADELEETKKELDELRREAAASAEQTAKIKSQAKEIKALNVEVEKSEQEITALLNEAQVAKAETTATKKKS